MFKVSYMPRIVPFLVLSFILSASAVGAKEKKKDKKFEFAKTKAFMCEMETRPDFPVSMVLANDYTYTLLATGNSIDPARKNSVIAYIKKAQQKNGGFISDKANNSASILFTDYALETLGYLNATNAVDTAKAKTFAASLKNPDGGFGFSQQAKGSSLASTFYAVRTLKTIGSLELVDRAQTAAYLKGFERGDGGFGYVQGKGAADPRNTYMAICTLDALGMLDQGTVKNALNFLGTTPYVKGKSSKKPELSEEFYAVKALKLLKAADRIDKKFALIFLKTLYIEPNGGFGPLQGYGAAPDSTATALRILSEIGTLKGGSALLAKK